jgi:glycosyltransferase involved in cell wall biosynthesis
VEGEEDRVLIQSEQWQMGSRTSKRRPRGDQAEPGRKSNVDSAPLIAVVVPTYKQPEFLKEAVLSAVHQSIQGLIRVVIVNDGCPFPSTDRTARFLQDAFPETVRYLHTQNEGPSAARNVGVRFALAAWPSLRAIFPLDDDNRLSRRTLERLWRELSRAPAEVGWVYQDFTIFGNATGIWRVGVPFNLYRLIFENVCDTGSLIRREVFESGIWYDEHMRSGFEDWEFYVNAGLSGFRGQHVPDTGFLYRMRSHSRNLAALKHHAALHEYILHKHRHRLRPRDLTRLEHEHMPRFAVVLVDKGEVVYATDLTSPGSRRMSVNAFVDEVNRSLQEAWPKPTYIPPITLFAYSSTLELLTRLRVLPGIAYGCQQLMPRFDCTALSLTRADGPEQLALTHDRNAGELILFAMRTRKWVELHQDFGKKAVKRVRKLKLHVGEFALQVGTAHLAAATQPDHQEDATKESSSTRSRSRRAGVVKPPTLYQLGLQGRHDRLQSRAAEMLAKIHGVQIHPERAGLEAYDRQTESHGALSDWWHAEVGKSQFPCPIGTTKDNVVNVAWAVPWLTLGGLDRCVQFLTAALARARSDIRHHLVVTAMNLVEIDPRFLREFDTVTFLPVDKKQRQKLLEDVLLAADVVINAHSLAAYEVLPALRARSRAIWMSYLHVLDLDDRSRTAGFPVVATHEYADVLDHFLVISRQLRNWCANSGIPDEKITIIPNAPTVFPPTLADALTFASKKGERSYASDRPLATLFAGRFDYQKGFDRLHPIVAGLRERNVPFQLTMLGRPVLTQSEPPPVGPDVRQLPSTSNAEVLATHYAMADVVLLPSRWEGVPLVILEAMAFGAIVIATNVGAIGEVVQDGRTGFLIDPNLPEARLVAAVCDRIAQLAAHPEEFRHLRQEAVHAAMQMSWDRSAARLGDVIDAAVVDRSEASGPRNPHTSQQNLRITR